MDDNMYEQLQRFHVQLVIPIHPNPEKNAQINPKKSDATVMIQPNDGTKCVYFIHTKKLALIALCVFAFVL